MTFLEKNPTYGIRPVLVVAENTDFPEKDCKPPVRTISTETLMKDPNIFVNSIIQTAIIVPGEIPDQLSSSLVDEQRFGIKHLILISDLNWIGGSAVIPHDMSGLLGLEVERNLLRLRERVVKKLLDFLLIICGFLVALPVICICALLIHLDSPGPVFYRKEEWVRRETHRSLEIPHNGTGCGQGFTGIP
jgi:hypothetical protein